MSSGQESTLTPVSYESKPLNRAQPAARNNRGSIDLPKDIRNSKSPLRRGKTYNPKIDNEVKNHVPIGLGNNIMITELSENYIEKDENPQLFEL